MQNDHMGAPFQYLKGNWPRRAIVGGKIEKTRFFTGFVAFLSVAVSPTRNFVFLCKKFFPVDLLEGILIFLLSFSVIYVSVSHFASCRERSLVRAGYTG